ncbi:MAG: hypothetical protein HRT38_10285 [Alteromonadaceae bacterium]|nr:hypothetical protein [Alteromonadaceae bacterium]
MKCQTITLYTQAVLWTGLSDFKIEHNTVEQKSYGLFIYVTLFTQSIRIKNIDVDQDKLTQSRINYFQAQKDNLKTETQLKLQSFDEQIDNLSAIGIKEYKNG